MNLVQAFLNDAKRFFDRFCELIIFVVVTWCKCHYYNFSSLASNRRSFLQLPGVLSSRKRKEEKPYVDMSICLSNDNGL